MNHFFFKNDEKKTFFYAQKNGIYFLKAVDIENDKKLNFNTNYCLYNTKNSDKIKFFEGDSNSFHIYFIETMNNTDYIRIYDEIKNKVEDKIIPLSGQCIKFSRFKKYVIVVV